MFFSILLKCVPSPDRFLKMVRLSSNSALATAYSSWWDGVREQAIQYYKRELVTHDFGYRMREAQHELVRRREEARIQGIGPGDARYPDIFDVIGDETIRYRSK